MRLRLMLTVITGAPCSGKSTYARQHATPGDIIIDFDTLAQAFGSPVSHGHDHPVWKVTAEARDAAIQAAIGQHRAGASVWVIDSKPAQDKRDHYARHGALFVDLAAPPQELHRRAAQAGRPPRWHTQIDKFLNGKDPQPTPRTAW
jgi:predicted kinase